MGHAPGWSCWAFEVGGRWSTETRTFLSLLAHGRARSERPLMRKRVEQAWRLCCPVLRHALWPCLCWTFQVPEEPTGIAPCPTTWSKISDMPLWTCGELVRVRQFVCVDRRGQIFSDWGPKGPKPKKMGSRRPRRVGGPKFRVFSLPGRSMSLFLGVFSWNFGCV